jgi:hypothetical protein
MSTHDVERELTAVLRGHAEDAMDSTDTQAEHERLNDVLGAEPRDDRRRLAVGAAVAGAAVAAVAVVWSISGDEARTGLPPTEEPDSGRAADEAVAQEYITAFVAGDVRRASSLLAPSSEEFPGGRLEIERNVAWGVEYLFGPCRTTTDPLLTEVVYVDCRFDMHLLSSREVGAGPFTGNNFSVVVEDGEVVSADTTYPFETNGISEHVDAFWAWMEDNHPEDTAFLGQDEPDVPAADWDRWLRLYEKRVGEYGEAMTSEGDG